MNPAFGAELRDDVLRLTASGEWSLKTAFTGDSGHHGHGHHESDQAGVPDLDKPVSDLHADQAEALVRERDFKELSFAVNDLESWDSSLLVAFIRLARAAMDKDKKVRFGDLPKGMARLLTLALESYKAEEKNGPPAKVDPGFLEVIGTKTLNAPKVLRSVLAFIGSVTASIGRLLRGKAAVSQQDVWRIFRECGVDALPIVALTSMLLGLILAFVSSIQLQSFGAEIYTAALVGLAMVRVMGPVLTGIVLSGRTGASFAAIISSMQVNEEVDALSTFGIDPVDFLVLPRVVGLVIMMPLLTVYADIMGIVGGFLVGITMLDLNPSVYLENTWSTIKLSHFVIGLFHAFVFGFVVSLAGCYQGLKSGRSAEGVGVATTNAVVYSIVGIIVSTSIITVVLTVIDL